MIKKIYKLKTEDYKLPFKSIYNGDLLNIRIHTTHTPSFVFDGAVKVYNRYGVNINNKVDKSAVERNRMRRIIFKILKDKEAQKVNQSHLLLSNKNNLYIIILKKIINKEDIRKLKDEINIILC